MATARESTKYANRYTNKYVVDVGAAEDQEKVVPFDVTIVSAAATGDTYKLWKAPAGATITGLFCTTDGLSASAGAGLTVSIGDASSATRLMAATDLDASGNQGHLAMAGSNYQYTADTDILATITGTPVVGQKISGQIRYVMF